MRLHGDLKKRYKLMRNVGPLLFLASAFFSTASIRAQVPLDSSFVTPGFYSTHSPYIVSATVAQPDGKMIVAGAFVRYNDQPCTNIVRLHTSGSLDTTFDRTAKTNGTISKLFVQKDGKILLSGTFNSFKNRPINQNLIRLHADGSFDSSFTAPATVQPGYGQCFAEQADGKLLIGGLGVRTGNFQLYEIVRLHSNGAIDATFDVDPHMISNQFVFALAVQPDGKILAAGSFTSFASTDKNNIVRLNTDGTVDNTFDVAGAFIRHNYNGTAYIMALLPLQDGSILAGGTFYTCGDFVSPGVIRLFGNGTVDRSFQTPDVFEDNFITRLDTANKKVWAGGRFYSSGNQSMLQRFNGDGSMDTSFTNSITDPYGSFCDVQTVVVLSDSSINIGGSFSVHYQAKGYTGFAQYTKNGHIDETVSVRFQRIGAVYKTLVAHDGKIMVGGVFNLYGNRPVNNLARLLPSGALDTSFHTGNGPDDIVTQIAETKNNEFYISGNFKHVNGQPANGVARLLSNGVLDTLFATGAGPNDGSYVYSILPLADGKLLAGGSFSTFNGYPSKGIIQLLANGAIDAGFKVPAVTPWHSIGTMAALSNNQILVGDNSSSSTLMENLPLKVWKLNADGTIDSSFATQEQGGYPVAVKLSTTPQNNIYYAGELIKHGQFNQYTFTKKLLRLRSDGAADSSSANFPNLFYVADFKVLGDSAILACGRSLDWNDSANYIMRFKPDLLVDSSFNPIALYYELRSLDCMPDGRIVVAGEPVRFFNLDTEPIPNIAVLKSPSLRITEGTMVINNIAGVVDAGDTTTTGNTITTQLTLYNTGTTAISLNNGSNIALVDGPDAASFRIANSNINTLRKNDSLTLAIHFTPASVGTKTARITIPYNNGIRQRYSFTLVATATGVVTAIDEVGDESATIVFPNPNRGSFLIKTPLQRCNLFVYDATGRMVMTKRGLPANKTVPIQLRQPGVYWLKIGNTKKTVVRPVLVQ